MRGLKDIERPVLPAQVLTICKGIDRTFTYDTVVSLKERGLLALNWTETELLALVMIDEDRAWPSVQAYISGNDGFQLERLINALSPERKRVAVQSWVEKGADYHFYVRYQIDLVTTAGFSPREVLNLLRRIEEQVTASRMKLEEKAALLKKIRRAQTLAAPK
jgi:hypothetical protein